MKQVYHHFQEIDSTNGWAKRHANELAENQLTIISTDAQTNGYGQFGRSWVTPKNKNIALTFCFWTEPKRPDLIYLALLLAKSASKVIGSLGFHTQLKWPNDILIEGKKVAGTLCETIFQKERVLAIAGIGVNVNSNDEDLQEVGLPATSLAIQAGRSFNHKAVQKAVVQQFATDLDQFLGISLR